MKDHPTHNVINDRIAAVRSATKSSALIKGATFAFAALSLSAFAGCAKKESRTEQEKPRAVRVHQVGAKANTPIKGLQFTGVVRARTESNLAFRVSGKVASRLVNAGEVVKAGQPLLKLDATDYLLALQAAQAVMKQAALEYERVRILVEKRAESRDALDRATAAAQASAAQAEQLANQVAYTTLYADSDGLVMSTLAEPGQVVSAGQPVLVLAKDGRREAAVDIPESSVGVLSGAAATASSYLNPVLVVPATLREISGVADPVARTYQARYVLEGESSRFPLGSTVTLHVAGSSEDVQGAFEVPIGSLIDRGDGAAVWIVDPGTSKIARRPVAIAKLGEETVTLREGVKAGEVVVALGAQLLHDGEVVQSVKEVR